MPADTLKSTDTGPQAVAAARRCFNVAGWSEGYFDIRADGRVVCRPERGGDVELSLTDLVRAAADNGLHPPLLMRFPDILADRVGRLCAAFDRARTAHDFDGPYTVVYPIKVNQQRCVVEHIVQAAPGRVGLEAGSKPELMAVLAQSFYKSNADDLETIICNGYKDREYVRLALIGSQLGKRVVIVIEQPEELDVVLEQAAALEIRPCLGVRVRLASIAKGKWQNSGGEKSKFGLSAVQLLELVGRLKRAGRLECLQLLHFHVGSQVADRADLDAAVREAARFYQELHRLGAAVNVLDVGGGLGVDYEGAGADTEFSMNYHLDDYAETVVGAVAERCREAALPHPEIITESGRALTAHHAVLITDVLDVERVDGRGSVEGGDHPVADKMHDLVMRAEQVGRTDEVAELLNECEALLRQGQQAYLDGRAGLEQRARIEALGVQCQDSLTRRMQSLDPADPLCTQLTEKLADKYFCNFSLFQSLPDVWGIGQCFPIMPLARLNEPLRRHAIIHDLTCDSDGQIADYPQAGGIAPTLPVHELHGNEPYYLGVFMVGAYQEILGDMHNLFGDTNSINVMVTRGGDYRLEGAEPGDRIDELLEYLHYDARRLLSQYKLKLERTRLNEADKQQYYLELAAGLSGYTYLEE